MAMYGPTDTMHWEPPHTQVRYRPSSTLAGWTVATVLASAVVSVTLALTGWLIATTPRVPNYNWQSPRFAIAPVDWVDIAVSLLALPLGLAAAVLAIVWLWRARDNSEQMAAARHRRSRVWVWLGWLVPVVSLWFPYQVAADVWRASDPGSPPQYSEPVRSTSASIRWWWSAFLASVVVESFGLEWSADRITVSDLERLAAWQTVSAVLTLAAAVLWTLLVRAVQRDQRARADRLAAMFPGSVPQG